MKFALRPTQFITWDLFAKVDSTAKAMKCIDKMYAIAYGGRAGPALDQKLGLTPNEERLIAALQERFGSGGRYNPIVVTCGEFDFVFACESDEYGNLIYTGDDFGSVRSNQHSIVL